jgi:hypothetical protein
MAPRAAGKKPGKPELTEEQKQEIREAFDLFDTDGSGEGRCGCHMECLQRAFVAEVQLALRL